MYVGLKSHCCYSSSFIRMPQIFDKISQLIWRIFLCNEGFFFLLIYLLFFPENQKAMKCGICFLFHTVAKTLYFCTLSISWDILLLYAWTSLYMDGTAVKFFWWSAHMRRELGTQITPRGWICWTMIFYNLKKFKSRSI